MNKEKFTIQFESLSAEEGPVMVTQPEFMRRMMEQQKLGGGGMMGAFPEMYNMIVNSNHPNVIAVLSKRGKTKKYSKNNDRSCIVIKWDVKRTRLK